MKVGPGGYVLEAALALDAVEPTAGTLLGFEIQVNDVFTSTEVASRLFDRRGVVFADGPYAAAEGADALMLVTEWNEFRQPDLARLKAILRTPVVLDGRNVWDASKLRAAGFTYYGVGRNAAEP